LLFGFAQNTNLIPTRLIDIDWGLACAISEADATLTSLNAPSSSRSFSISTLKAREAESPLLLLLLLGSHQNADAREETSGWLIKPALEGGRPTRGWHSTRQRLRRRD
jgi:hypothetical protein